MRYRQEAEPTWLLVLRRRELRKVFLLHDLVSEPSRRRRGAAPDRSLAYALRVAVVLRRHEHAAHELRRRIVTARRLIAREVSLGQTLGNGAAQKRREFAMSGLRGALEPLLAGTWR
jgi:Mg-chelatase subunit ChlI